MLWFFGCEACGILAPQPEIEPSFPELKGEVLTTRPAGKSQVPPNFKTMILSTWKPFLKVIEVKFCCF